jgi:tRNA-splicing endonuclease subunit Sen54
VYSYLKRLGYVVTRSVPPSPAYPMPQPAQTKTLIPASRRAGVLSHLLLPLHSFLRGLTSLLLRIGASRFDCWHPLRLTGIYAPQDSGAVILLCSAILINLAPASIYRSLRAVAPPQGHSVLSPNDAAASPYKVFFNLYKPATPFRKTAPPAPDFQIVVIE